MNLYRIGDLGLNVRYGDMMIWCQTNAIGNTNQSLLPSHSEAKDKFQPLICGRWTDSKKKGTMVYLWDMTSSQAVCTPIRLLELECICQLQAPHLSVCSRRYWSNEDIVLTTSIFQPFRRDSVVMSCSKVWIVHSTCSVRRSYSRLRGR